jgi:hypothetical protein
VTSAPAAAPAERTGRNDPCPCGSGRDFKQCCGAAHPAPAAANPPRNARPDRVNFGPLSEVGRLREAAEEFRHRSRWIRPNRMWLNGALSVTRAACGPIRRSRVRYSRAKPRPASAVK